jgi:putative phosphoesterase
MTTKIGLISDTHSTTKPLVEAMALFRKQKVDKIICAGDIAGYGEDDLQQTIDLLIENNCLLISGNHDVAWSDRNPLIANVETQTFLNALPLHLELTIENIKIKVVHASPPDKQHGGIKLLDQEGQVIDDVRDKWSDKLKFLDCDVLVVGHSHQVFAQHLGSVYVLNPGSTCFNHSCMILSLPDMKVETFALSGKEILKTWNWGLFYQEQSEIK